MSSLILPQFAELQELETKIKQEKGLVDGKRQQYEDYQGSLNHFRNKQKELDGKTNRREKIKNKLLNMSVNIKQRDFTQEMADIEDKVRQLFEENKVRTSRLN